MIFINKENGSIIINKEINIIPHENIRELQFKLKDKIYNPKYGYNKNNNFMLDDEDLGVVYTFKTDKNFNIHCIYIEPQYSSWEDIENSISISIVKIKKILELLNLEENNLFLWGRIFYEYDPRNLIPSIIIEYKNS